MVPLYIRVAENGNPGVGSKTGSRLLENPVTHPRESLPGFQKTARAAAAERVAEGCPDGEAWTGEGVG